MSDSPLKRYQVSAVMEDSTYTAYTTDDITDHAIESVIRDCFNLGAISVVIRDVERNKIGMHNPS